MEKNFIFCFLKNTSKPLLMRVLDVEGGLFGTEKNEDCVIGQRHCGL